MAGLRVAVVVDRVEGSEELLLVVTLSDLRVVAEVVRVDVSVRVIWDAELLLWLMTGVFCSVLFSPVGCIEVKRASPSLL